MNSHIRNFEILPLLQNETNMRINTNELNLCYSLIDAKDIKLFAKMQQCTEALVRAVLRGDRENEEIILMAYKRAKEKAEKMLVFSELIEKRNKEYFRLVKEQKLTFSFEEQ